MSLFNHSCNKTHSANKDGPAIILYV